MLKAVVVWCPVRPPFLWTQMETQSRSLPVRKEGGGPWISSRLCRDNPQGGSGFAGPALLRREDKKESPLSSRILQGTGGPVPAA